MSLDTAEIIETMERSRADRISSRADKHFADLLENKTDIRERFDNAIDRMLADRSPCYRDKLQDTSIWDLMNQVAEKMADDEAEYV